jgi:hypothetical protein
MQLDPKTSRLPHLDSLCYQRYGDGSSLLFCGHKIAEREDYTT